MRFLLKVQWDMDAGNALARQGKIGETVAAILEDLKPEAAYFAAVGGNRGGYLIVNMDDPAELPAIAEPWFLTFNADVEFHVVMTPQDLNKAGLDELGRKWG